MKNIMIQPARTSEQIKAGIEERFGFFPLFFSPALETQEALENLWQQTLSAYVNNPLQPYSGKSSSRVSRDTALFSAVLSATVATCSVVLTIASVRDAAGKLVGL